MEEVAIYNKEQSKGIEAFQKMLNSHPDKSEIKVNTFANNSKYVAIEVVERKLDEMYNGLWQVDNFRWNVIANEIVGSLDLKVYHPTFKQWLTRTGAGSVMIQTIKSKQPTLENKITNCLVSMFPKLKAECIKNAAKSLGSAFGRTLNRGAEDDFSYLSEQVSDIVTGTDEAYNLLETSTLSDKVRQTVEAKIQRANSRTIKQIINYLNQNE